MHFSHFKIDTSKNKLPHRQSIPGHCILCPKQFYTNVKVTCLGISVECMSKDNLKFLAPKYYFVSVVRCPIGALTGRLKTAVLDLTVVWVVHD